MSRKVSVECLISDCNWGRQFDVPSGISLDWGIFLETDWPELNSRVVKHHADTRLTDKAGNPSPSEHERMAVNLIDNNIINRVGTIVIHGEYGVFAPTTDGSY